MPVAQPMERDDWCKQFLTAWLLREQDADRSFVLLVARRTFDHEGQRTEPQVAAREHIAFLEKVRAATLPRPAP